MVTTALTSLAPGFQFGNRRLIGRNVEDVLSEEVRGENEAAHLQLEDGNLSGLSVSRSQ